MIMNRRISFVLFILLGMSTMALAYNNTYALVIGVADYKNFSREDGDLNFTIKDAENFAAFLKSKKGGSVPASNIILLTNAQASKENIIAKGKALFAKAKKDDRVIFYFSGHGSKGCFMPYDAGDIGNSLLYFNEVKSIFRSAKCNTKLLFADACFSGSMRLYGTYRLCSRPCIPQVRTLREIFYPDAYRCRLRRSRYYGQQYH